MKPKNNEAALLLVLDQLSVESNYLDAVVESAMEMQQLLRIRKPNAEETSEETAGQEEPQLKLDPSDANRPNATNVAGSRSPHQSPVQDNSTTQSGLSFVPGSHPDSKNEAVSVPDLKAEQDNRIDQRLENLRRKIETDFIPVVKGRRTMIDVLRSLNPDAARTPTLTELAGTADEPMRSELKRLRNEIRDKLNQIQSISMGNQAVLLYTLDFYNRLLAGLSGGGATPGLPQTNCYNASGQTNQPSTGNIVRTNC